MQGTRTLHVPCFLIIGGVDEEAPIANTFAPELFGEYPVGDDIGVSIDNRYIPASYVVWTVQSSEVHPRVGLELLAAVKRNCTRE